MNEKSQASSLRRYPLVNPLIGNEHESMSNSSFSSSSSREYQQLIPINLEHVSTLGNLSSKRRRSSITSESSRPNLISTIPEDFIDQRMSSRRKRSAQDDIDAYPSPHMHRDHDRYVSETKTLIHFFILIFRRTNELVMNVLEALNSKINLHVQHWHLIPFFSIIPMIKLVYLPPGFIHLSNMIYHCSSMILFLLIRSLAQQHQHQRPHRQQQRFFLIIHQRILLLMIFSLR